MLQTVSSVLSVDLPHPSLPLQTLFRVREAVTEVVQVVPAPVPVVHVPAQEVGDESWIFLKEKAEDHSTGSSSLQG